ncbi:MAG: hypothetical protein JF606_12760 [Burkholderiales bacterium]|nr:hypothetical protein [Burkholderiales bacterium]
MDADFSLIVDGETAGRGYAGEARKQQLQRFLDLHIAIVDSSLVRVVQRQRLRKGEDVLRLVVADQRGANGTEVECSSIVHDQPETASLQGRVEVGFGVGLIFRFSGPCQAAGGAPTGHVFMSGPNLQG